VLRFGCDEVFGDVPVKIVHLKTSQYRGDSGTSCEEAAKNSDQYDIALFVTSTRSLEGCEDHCDGQDGEQDYGGFHVVSRWLVRC
jgi:hypothetical protein